MEEVLLFLQLLNPCRGKRTKLYKLFSRGASWAEKRYFSFELLTILILLLFFIVFFLKAYG